MHHMSNHINMSMYIFHMSSRTKLIVLALSAVLAPVIVLSLLQYRSLRDLQQQTKMASQENLRQAASRVTSATAEYFHDIGADTLMSLKLDKELDDQQVRQVNDRVAELLKSRPEVGRVFTVSYCSCKNSQGTAIVQTREGARTLTG